MRARPFTMFNFRPGNVLRKELPFLHEYNLQLYKGGASLFPSLSFEETVGDVIEATRKFADVSNVFTYVWIKHSDPREYLRNMKRGGYVEEILEYVYEPYGDLWKFKDGVCNWETEI